MTRARRGGRSPLSVPPQSSAFPQWRTRRSSFFARLARWARALPTASRCPASRSTVRRVKGATSVSAAATSLPFLRRRALGAASFCPPTAEATSSAPLPVSATQGGAAFSCVEGRAVCWQLAPYRGALTSARPRVDAVLPTCGIPCDWRAASASLSAGGGDTFSTRLTTPGLPGRRHHPVCQERGRTGEDRRQARGCQLHRRQGRGGGHQVQRRQAGACLSPCPPASLALVC